MRPGCFIRRLRTPNTTCTSNKNVNKGVSFLGGPSTQFLKFLVSKTILSMVSGTRDLKYWVLGPPGVEKTKSSQPCCTRPLCLNLLAGPAPLNAGTVGNPKGALVTIADGQPNGHGSYICTLVRAIAYFNPKSVHNLVSIVLTVAQMGSPNDIIAAPQQVWVFGPAYLNTTYL